MELLLIISCCAILVGILYTVSAIYRARQQLKKQREIARSDSWERKWQQRDTHYDNFF